MRLLKQSSTDQKLTFRMASSGDHVMPVTGITPAVTISKAGGSFASPAGAVSEIGSGWYKVAGNAADTNTLGPLILHATGTGADPADREFQVVAFDPQDATSLGLANLSGAPTLAEMAAAVRDVDNSDPAPSSLGAKLALVSAVKAKTDLISTGGVAEMEMTAAEIAALVDEGCRLDREIAERERRLIQVKAALTKLAPGVYAADDGHTAQVIQPTPGIKPSLMGIAAAREALEEKEFKTLFDHVAQWKPIKDFRAKASVLLTPAKLRRVIAVCEVPAKPYVIFR